MYMLTSFIDVPNLTPYSTSSLRLRWFQESFLCIATIKVICFLSEFNHHFTTVHHWCLIPQFESTLRDPQPQPGLVLQLSQLFLNLNASHMQYVAMDNFRPGIFGSFMANPRYSAKKHTLHVRCNPDVAPRRNCGRVAYIWNAMSADFQYVNVYVIHDHEIMIIIMIIMIIIIMIIIIIIPYEDKFMLLLDSPYLPQGVKDLWIPYMKICWCYYQIQHICHKGWRICWSLMKIGWCHYPI